MQRSIVALALIFIFFGMLTMFYSYKDAYQILPVQPPTQLDEEIDQGWKEYKDDQAGFTANFPTEPLKTAENVRVPDTKELRLYKVYASETPDGKVYMVSIVTFSEEAYRQGNDALMHRFVSELVDSKPDNKLDKLEYTTFKNATGYEFSIQNPDSKMDGLVFMIGKVLYLLTEFVPKGLDDNDFTQFKDKFELLTTDTTNKKASS